MICAIRPGSIGREAPIRVSVRLADVSRSAESVSPGNTVTVIRPCRQHYGFRRPYGPAVRD